MRTLTILLLLTLATLHLLPPLVAADYECSPEDDEINKAKARPLKITAVFTILVGGSLVVVAPILRKSVPALRPHHDVFFVVKTFAAGVILSASFVDILSNATESLTSPCLSDKPSFAGFFTLVVAIATLISNTLERLHSSEETSPVKRVEEHAGNAALHTHGANGHDHGVVADGRSSELIRHRVISQVFLSISVIIGISLGALQSPKTIRPHFHQFFEGLGLGGCIVQISTQAQLKARSAATVVIFFSLATPVGIAIGMGVSSTYDENSPIALIVTSIVSALGSGILVLTVLVKLLAADFMNPGVKIKGWLQFGLNILLLLGAGLMYLLYIEIVLVLINILG